MIRGIYALNIYSIHNTGRYGGMVKCVEKNGSANQFWLLIGNEHSYDAVLKRKCTGKCPRPIAQEHLLIIDDG